MSPQDERFRMGKRLAIASISASTVLASANVTIGALAGSTSVFAAGLEFAGDVLASVVVYLGMSFASRPADENHPYGHGRSETLAGLAVGTILLLGGVGICFQSLGAVGENHPPPGGYAMWPLCGAIVIRSVMSTLKFRYGRRIGSASLVADAWNDAVDILSALAGLAALALTLYRPERFLAADHYGGFAIGLIVVLTGVRVMRDASMQLMDTMPDEELLGEIRAAALAVSGARGVEKCFARKTGLQHHVDLHLEVDRDLSVWESHEIAARVRTCIRETLPSVADVLVHVEPSPLATPRP